MICKNCGSEFEGKYSKWCSGDFCCKKCAKSFSTKAKRQEINEKVSLGLRGPYYKLCENCGGRNYSKGNLCRKCKPKKNIKQKRKENAANVTRWIRRVQVRLIEYKGGKCIKCGYNKCVAGLCFHHRDPNEKDFLLSGTYRSFERLKEEADKCDLMCLNCHAELHLELYNGSVTNIGL